MKYIYMLAWSILGTGLSIATDDAALNALGKQTDNQPLKRSISTPVTQQELSQLDITNLHQEIQEKAAIELLYAMSNDVTLYFDKNYVRKKTNKEVINAAADFKVCYQTFNGGMTLNNHIAKRFTAALEQLFKELPAMAYTILQKPATYKIIGLSYLCCKHLQNSELFLLLTSSILETSALEIACGLIDQEHKTIEPVTRHSITYRRWIANESIPNVVKYLRMYAQHIFDIYKSHQKTSCNMLQQQLFTGESNDKYIQNNTNAHTSATQMSSNFEQKINALKEHLKDDDLKEVFAQSMSSMKTFLTHNVKEFQLNCNNRAAKIISQNRAKLQHQHGMLLLNRFFINNHETTDTEITHTSNFLYMSMLKDYCLDKFITFFNLLDSGNHYKQDPLGTTIKRLQDEKMEHILDVIDTSKRSDQIITYIKAMEDSYSVYCKKIEEVRRLLKENLTKDDKSLDVELNKLKILLKEDASKRMHLYANQQEIDNQVEYVIKRISDFIADNSES